MIAPACPRIDGGVSASCKRPRFVQLRLLAPQLLARLVAQRFLLERRQHARAQQRRIERLEQEILGAELDAAHHGVDLAHRRNHDDRQVVDAALLAQAVEHAEAVELRHHDVEQHQVVAGGGDGRERLHAVRRLVDLADAQPLEPADQQVAIFRDVVDDEDPRAGGGHVDVPSPMSG